MVLGLKARAEGRAADVRRDIGDLLNKGDSLPAFHRSLRALQSELRKLSRHRAADGALTYAELAGSIAATAAQIHAHKPRRPAGCSGYPRPEHLIAAFNSSYAPGEDWS